MMRIAGWILGLLTIAAFLPSTAAAETNAECKARCQAAHKTNYDTCKKSDHNNYPKRDGAYKKCLGKAGKDRVAIDKCNNEHELACQKYAADIYNACIAKCPPLKNTSISPTSQPAVNTLNSQPRQP